MLDRIVPLPLFINKLQGRANQLGVGLSAERFRALDGSTEGAVDDELGQDTKSARDTEEDSVVVGFSESIVLQQDTGMLDKQLVGIN